MRRYAGGIVALAVVLCLVIGFLVTGVLDKKLAISFSPKDVAPETSVTADSVPIEAAERVRVSLPEERANDRLLAVATRDVGTADAQRAEQVARLTGDAGTSAPPVTVSVEIKPVPGANPETYSIDRAGQAVTVRASDRRGAAYGLFRIADAVRSGRSVTSVATGESVTPRLSQRFVDAGAVGLADDPKPFVEQTDYQHNVGPLSRVLTDKAPYYDDAELKKVEQQFRDYVDRAVAMGYNGIYVPGFLEYVDFDAVGNGHEVYPADSPYRTRHKVMVERIAPLWKYAHEMGMKVVFRTDMLALSKPLEDHLTRTIGSLDSNDPRLWDVYRKGLDEFLTTVPWADGLQVRIGEGGSIYNASGWNYYSALKVTDPKGVKAMLDAFTDVAGRHGKTIWFRTWSVGVGKVGDMHTNPETYEKVLGAVQADNLVVSTKFVAGDFDSWLQLNPTLMGGPHRRIIEMQGRREFEAFGSLPDDLTSSHQLALQKFLNANPKVEGLWLWTQDGGPVHAGPRTLYPRVGFWQLYDINAYAAGRLAWDPEVPAAQVKGDWIRATFTLDPDGVQAVSRAFSQSREAILKGLYISPYASQQVKALGLEPPPMMWIFKWDLVSGDTASLSAIAAASRGHVPEAIAEGGQATQLAQSAVRDFAVDATRFRDPALAKQMEHSLAYQASLMGTLQHYRTAFLSYYEWLDTGSGAAKDAWQRAVGDYERARDAHLRTYTGDVATPPYYFGAADQGLKQMDRSMVGLWVARAVLLLSVLALALVLPLRAGAFTPWRVREAVPEPSRGQRPLVLAAPLVAVLASRLTYSGGLSWAYLVATLGSLALLALVARLVVRRVAPGADPFWLWAVLGGVLLLRTAILAAGMSLRGPLAYWHAFWTNQGLRTVYVTIALAAFLYVFVALAVCLRCAYAARRRQSIGVVALGWGVPMLALGALLAGFGLETSLTTLNDQMAVLPMGLSKILGLTVHLAIPQSVPTYLLGAGGVLALLGLLLVLPRGRRRGADQGDRSEPETAAEATA